MNGEWKKIYSKNGKLMYEGFTKDGSPCGSGTSYYANGNKCREGLFDVKGLVYGREYYRNGNVRFEGAYRQNKGYGPNYPVFGSFCDENGNELYYGEFTIKKGASGYPAVVKPAEFGPVVHKGMPNLKMLTWSSEEHEIHDVCYVMVSGEEERRRFIGFLEKNGFRCEDCTSSGKEKAVGSRFPVKIDVGRKVYGTVGNVLCAAAAASARVLISAEDFLEIFEVMNSIVIV